MIYDPTGPGDLQRGDFIYVQGVVAEMNGTTAIEADIIVLDSSGNPVPAFSTLTAGLMNTEAYESVLVNVSDVTITDINIPEGEWTVTDVGANNAVVDSLFSYSYLPTLSEHIDWVQGPVTEDNGTYKLQPRDDQDISATYRQLPATDWIGLALLLACVGVLITRRK